MSVIKKIGIIGAGNVGSYLHRVLQAHGFDVELFSRATSKTTQPVETIYANPDKFDLILVCVSDDVISRVSELITPFDGIVAHVSGATPLQQIDEKHAKRAVFYPLMSLKGNNAIDEKTIPFCVEATDAESLSSLSKLANELGAASYEIDSESRKSLHLAAVLSHNFSNHLFHKAKMVMDEAGLDFRILLPLLENALQSLKSIDPKDLQTGPAIRHDDVTLNRHLNMLKDSSTIDIYKLLTQSIQDTYDKEL